MQYKKIPLHETDENIYLECYIPDIIGNYRRKAMLVIPGGGYHMVCSDREGEPIAQAFIPHGFAAFVLHYSVGQKRPFPAQLIEATKAIVHIKDHAEEYGIDPEQVFTVGFSAGGHLACSTGTLWKHPAVYEALNIPYGYNKPKGMILLYPVINGHYPSFQNLFCTQQPTEEQLKQGYLELHVDEDTVPAFIMHTANDQLVPVSNSLSFAKAMSDKNIPFEMHIYPDAPHGVALGNAITAGKLDKHNNPAIAQWINHAATWAENVE